MTDSDASDPDQDLLESVWAEARDLVRAARGQQRAARWPWRRATARSRSSAARRLPAGAARPRSSAGHQPARSPPAPGRAWASRRARAAPRARSRPRREVDNRVPVLAPLVGTFYRAAQPGRKPFVERATSSSIGQTVCIVEAMKLMNEVARRRGRQAWPRSWSRTASRSSSSRCSCTSSRSTSSRARVREGADRQPRRDRAAGRARLPRAGRQVGGGLLHRRRGVRGRPLRRRGGVRRPARAAARATCTSRTSSGPPQKTGADAIHPGYGFLSEDPFFAEICTDNDITFIGPEPGGHGEGRRQGDRARPDAEGRAAAAARHDRAGQTRRGGAARSPTTIGYPVIIKAVAGGGGRGMNVVRKPRGPRAPLPDHPRHGPGDLQGQRRLHRALPRRPAPHRGAARLRRPRQRRLLLRARLLGAAPPPEADRGGALDPPVATSSARDIGERAVKGALSVGYTGAGHDGVPARPRRQPELHGDERPHPGRAPGQRDDHRASTSSRSRSGWPRASRCRSRRRTSCCAGHAIECRINAEDPDRDFAPAAGPARRLRAARRARGPGSTRTATRAGRSRPFYDSLIAKLIVWAPGPRRRRSTACSGR